MTKSAIGIDLGGTRIKAVLVDSDGNIRQHLYTPTRDGSDAVWKLAVADTVTQLKSGLKESKLVVGISAPGIPDKKNSAIACMPGRLQGLEAMDWSAFLKLPSWVLNDAVAALVAEARLGAAVGFRHIVLLTLGTGVGGAILIDGKPYQGAFHKAGHLGHMVIDSTGSPDVTGMPGSLENAIGNVTIRERSGGRFEDTRELLEALRNGDEQAREIWELSVRKLAMGMASITNILSPEAIILGGGIAGAWVELLGPLEKYMEEYEWRVMGDRVRILRAKFGDLAGAIGAACFAREQSQ